MISPGDSRKGRRWSSRGVLLVLAMFAFGGLALAGLFAAQGWMSSTRNTDVQHVPTTAPTP